MQQRITLTHITAVNRPEPEEGEKTYRYSWEKNVIDEVVEEVFEGEIVPVIHHRAQSAMVELKDMNGRTARYVFSVIDVKVERLDDDAPVQAEVGGVTMR